MLQALAVGVALTAALASSTVFAATPTRRIHIPVQNVPDGVSPELVDTLLVEAEHRLEQFRIDASSGPTSVPSIKAEQSVTLQRQRVKVSIDWRDPGSGRSGRAYALPQADPFSFFYYDDPINPEIFVKVLDFGNTSPFLIFYAGLTSFEYTVTFENVCTGQKAVKFKPSGLAEGGFDNTSLSWCEPLSVPLAVPGVNSLNGVTGDVTLTGSGGATVSTNGNIISINTPAGSGGGSGTSVSSFVVIGTSSWNSSFGFYLYDPSTGEIWFHPLERPITGAYPKANLPIYVGRLTTIGKPLSN